MAHSVLVATDLSSAADEAILAGHVRSQRAGDRLAICHVLATAASAHSPGIVSDPSRTVPSDLRDEITAALVERVDSLTGRGQDGYDLLMPEGVPYAAIIQSAERWKADLIVVSSQGRTGLARMLLGSVAERVVRYAHASVLVARRSPKGDVLVGTDFSPPANPALHAAQDEARAAGVRLLALHAADLGMVMLGAMGQNADPADPRTHQLRSQLVDHLREHNIEALPIIAEGWPATALIKNAEQLGTSLVVVGTRGLTGLDRLVLGSVAEAVVRGAPCSTLVARPTA